MGTVNSIRGKFLQLTIISILLCALLLGSVALASVSSMQTYTARELLSLTCRAEGAELEATLHSIRAAVDVFSDLADAQVSSLLRLRNDSFLDVFCEEVEYTMLELARETPGVCACYFRIAPEMTRLPTGFFYSVHAGSDEFVRETLTDLDQYDPADGDHVGWYYLPQRAGHAVWLEPYYNQNLGVYMISYVCPLYRDGVFWGVAGMDIDFDVIIEHVRSIQSYETGYAFLASDSGEVYYHPELAVGESILSYSDELQAVVDAFAHEQGTHTTGVFHYHYRGVGKTLSYFELSNGMNLLLTARRSEIKAPMVSLFILFLIITLLMCAAVVAVVIAVSNRITRPLDKLTLAAKEIATGNMDVELPVAGADEVGILTRSLAVTVTSLKQHIAHMYDMAYTDPLTRVKNKTAYDKECLALEEQIREGGGAPFGLLMLDLNNLKALNDKYGHERGDEYLINCCALMCKVFKHSPVYRIGGDEFLILLRGEDLAALPELLEEMDRRMAASRKHPEPWKRLSIAKGYSLYNGEVQTLEEIFNRADEAMYADKRRMKQD